MKTLNHTEVSVGQVVVFVDRKLNRENAHVESKRAQRSITKHSKVDGKDVVETKKLPHLDGHEGVVVHVDTRTDHDTTCASKTKTVKVKIEENRPHPEKEGERVITEKEIDEHAACDCGFSPGKPICVVLKEPPHLEGVNECHTCDGYAPDGNGVWARADQLYTPEHHAAHKDAHEKSKLAAVETDKRKAAAHEAAKKYLGDKGKK